MSDLVPPDPISIIIPARNAETTLAVQLEALLAAGADQAHEVVVVDSGSTDGTMACAESFSHAFNRLIVLSAPAPGAATARNTGVAAASGELILFCDADDRVDPDWIRRLGRALEVADAAVGSLRVGGLVPLDQIETAEQRVLDPPEHGQDADEHLDLRSPIVPELSDPPNFIKVITANAGVRRTVFEQIGGFDSRYDGLGNEDGEFFFRLQLLGHQVATAPAAIVDYRLRASSKAQARQSFRNGRGIGLFYRQYGEEAARSGIRRSRLPRTVLSVLAQSRKAIRKDAVTERKYLWISLARASGCALGYHVDARRRRVRSTPDKVGGEYCEPASGDAPTVRTLLGRGYTSARFRLHRRRSQLAQWMVEADLRIRNRVERRPCIGDGPVVVSMTSHGQRISSCHLALESIARGTMQPGRLVLWLSQSENDSEVLPPGLVRLQARGLEVRWANENFGPANKLVHSVKVFPERPIVVADDDIVYPRNWLAELVSTAYQSPGCVVAHRCVRLEGTTRTNPPFVEALRPFAELTRLDPAGGVGPAMPLMGEGSFGVYYPPGSLNESVHDLELYKGLSARNDDVWFKAMTAINGVPTRRVRVENPPPYRTIAGTHQTALWHDNSQGLTDGAIRAVVEHFGLTEIIHDSRRPRDEDQIK